MISTIVYVFYIICAVFIFGSWSFSKRYKERGEKKGRCIAGIIFSILSAIMAIISIKECLYAFEVVENVERGIGADIYYAFSSNANGPFEVWSQAFFQMIVTLPWGIVSILAIRNYYKALTSKKEFNE